MKSLFRPFPWPLTGKQKFYIGFLQGVGAGFIDGGANFGIAYAMYHSGKPVKMWIFSQNTIAGDLGVTPIIQCLASMLITSALVHTDLHHGAIQPLPFCYPHVEHLPDPRLLLCKHEATSPSRSPKRRSSSGTTDGTVIGSEPDRGEKGITSHDDPWAGNHGLSYYYWMLVRFIFEGTEKNMLLAKPGFGAWWGRFAWTAAQGALIGIVFGFPLWCLAIVILGPIYKMDDMGSKWAPEVIKFVYAAILGWITNPVMAVLALGSQAEQSLLSVEVDPEAAEGTAGGEATETVPAVGEPGVPTIREDEELSAEVLASPPRRPRSPSDSFSRSSWRNRNPPSPLIVARDANIDGRSRANSNASGSSVPSFRGRPPLTANVSFLAPLASPLPGTPMVDGRLRAESNPPTAAGLATPGRDRGQSVSSNRSYSYVLGGMGGRAQRSRSNTATSAVGSAFKRNEGLGLGDDAGPVTAPPAFRSIGRRDSAPTVRPQDSPVRGLRPRSGTGGSRKLH